MKLTDWITDAAEAYMRQQMTKISIPEHITFEQLKLARDASGVTFDMAVITAICEASGIDPRLMIDAPEDNIAALIVGWYDAHRQQGGAADPVAEDLLQETLMEDSRGQNSSHPAGRA